MSMVFLPSHSNNITKIPKNTDIIFLKKKRSLIEKN